mgnify:CR=1 FL=1
MRNFSVSQFNSNETMIVVSIVKQKVTDKKNSVHVLSSNNSTWRDRNETVMAPPSAGILVWSRDF